MTQVKNKKAGELHAALSNEEWEKTTEVCVEGEINFSDWQFLGQLAHKKLEAIDIQHTTGLRMTGDLNHIFYGSATLSKVLLPEGITLIDEKCFEDCTHLSEVRFPESLNNIGGYAFLHCGLKDVVLPDKLKRFGPRTFADCSDLKTVKLPRELEEIGYCAFEECINLEKIEIPRGVKTLPEEVFMNCVKLRTVKLNEGLSEIKEGAFEYCTGLEEIVLPKTVNTIGSKAFKGCSSLKKIVIPEGVTTIEEKTFEDCRSLVSVVLPQSVTKISKEAFRGCKNLEKIVLPEAGKYKIESGYITRFGVRTIDDEAFRDCTKLKNIELPSSIANLGSYVFRDCSSLETIHCNAKVPPFCVPKTFHWTDNLKVAVPEDAKTAYAKAYGWNEVMDVDVDDLEIVSAPSDFSSLPKGADKNFSLKNISTDKDTDDVNPSNGALFGKLPHGGENAKITDLSENDNEEVNPSDDASFGKLPKGAKENTKLKDLKESDDEDDVNPSIGASF